METYEDDDDDQARCIEELVRRAFADPPNLFLHHCYGRSQEPVIVTHGRTTKELLPLKHGLNARIDGHSIQHPERSSAHIERWHAVRTAKLLLANHEFRYSEDPRIVIKRNCAQDIVNWGVEHKEDEDHKNP